MPQLDGLRALAVLSVWFSHWGIGNLPVFTAVNWGEFGVMLFFILSGFLITGILLRARDSVDAGDCGIWQAARIFYIRRFLRILPIYYLTLFAMALLLPEVRHLFAWYATYTANILFATHPMEPPPGGHFWSLAAEEQFYLVWPWAILLIPRRGLAFAAFGLVGLGAALRIILAMHGHRALAVGCIDEFGLGAALAITSACTSLAQIRHWLLRLGVAVAMPAGIIMLIFAALYPDHPLIEVAGIPLAIALFFTWVIGGAASGFGGWWGQFLQSRPLVYLGRISYGLYIYHGFVGNLWAKAGLQDFNNPFARTLVFGIITTLVASISWFTIESPINSLKHRFQTCN